ncbi:pentapeptide repeat-containing protein [Nostoc sp.]|uniref:pentapeptide repeat-containing protein n=1 Tax=Nostoc sp. TaxID=1180 RepID=UPI002FF93728
MEDSIKFINRRKLLKRYADGERDFAGIRISSSGLDGEDLREIDLSGADLIGVDLSGSNPLPAFRATVYTQVVLYPYFCQSETVTLTDIPPRTEVQG